MENEILTIQTEMAKLFEIEPADLTEQLTITARYRELCKKLLELREKLNKLNDVIDAKINEYDVKSLQYLTNAAEELKQPLPKNITVKYGIVNQVSLVADSVKIILEKTTQLEFAGVFQNYSLTAYVINTIEELNSLPTGHLGYIESLGSAVFTFCEATTQQERAKKIFVSINLDVFKIDRELQTEFTVFCKKPSCNNPNCTFAHCNIELINLNLAKDVTILDALDLKLNSSPTSRFASVAGYEQKNIHDNQILSPIGTPQCTPNLDILREDLEHGNLRANKHALVAISQTAIHMLQLLLLFKGKKLEN